MPPDALREDPGRFDRRRVVQVAHEHQRLDREAPRPTLALGVIFGIARDFDDAEDRLPDSGVENRAVALLHRRPLGGRVAPDVLATNQRVERSPATAADQQPARQSRSITEAIAWPKPMHIVATP